MSGPLVLSLFPGIGLLDMAFEEEGFCVVRGPDVLWGGDIREFHPPAGKFEGVIGGPPCQMFSQMRHIQPLAGKKHGNLIPEFERVVSEAKPSWFVMENVRDAPLPWIDRWATHDQLLKDVWVGGDTMRLRRITFGTPMSDVWRDSYPRLNIQQVALHTQEPEVSALAGGGDRSVPVAYQRSNDGELKMRLKKRRQHNTGPRSVLEHAGNSANGLAARLKAQGLPDDFLADAPFTKSGKSHAIGNGVPLPMGRAIAKAVKRAMYPDMAVA